MDLDLDTLKREITEYLDASGFAIFRSNSGGLEGLPMLLWDTEGYPDYQMFLDVARTAGIKLILFACREFEAADVDELLEQLDGCGLPREEQREYESRLGNLRAFDGVTCSLELAFDYHTRLYVYELQPDWYEEFLNLEEEITGLHAGDEDVGSDGSMGGYFSNN
jgi:hypothetical protein